MFKKLKEKITEEVKISPQRFQQLTQSVSDKLQGTSTPDENMFSIGEDDENTSIKSDQGFSSVTLVSPSETRCRRMSNSSLASDVSFLPRYEAGSFYQLQSDLDISASEIEDNGSQASSQLGYLSKEQIHSAFQKSQMRYHKYRGRYTDLARHYKELERENSKMKSILVETQEKAIRRTGELKEQCALEQKAKAHLESALRDELEEKQMKIQSLHTKIELLQENGSVADIGDGGDKSEQLTKYLNDARDEIEMLNEKIQEYKATSIVFQTKEMDYKNRITSLEKDILSFSQREKENNLKLAENKMELHKELLNKDSEVAKLKKEIDSYKNCLNENTKSTKIENLQTQNYKLIEKVENLTQRCNSLDNELLKVEKYKLEITALSNKNILLNQQVEATSAEKTHKFDSIRKTLTDFQETREQLQKIVTNQRQQFELEIKDLHDKTLDILKMQSEKNKTNEVSDKHDSLEELFSRMKEVQEQLFETEKRNEELQNSVLKMTETIIELEKKSEAEKENGNQKINTYHENFQKLQDEISTLKQEITKLEIICQEKENLNIELSKENLNLQSINKELTQKSRLLEEKQETLELDISENSILQLKLQKLEEEKEVLLASFEEERKVFNKVMEDHNELKVRDGLMKEFEGRCGQLEDKIVELKEHVTEKESLLFEVNKTNFDLEQELCKSRESLRLLEEKQESVEVEKTECNLLQIKVHQLETEKKNLLKSFGHEKECQEKHFQEKNESLLQKTETLKQEIHDLKQVLKHEKESHSCLTVELAELKQEKSLIQDELETKLKTLIEQNVHLLQTCEEKISQGRLEEVQKDMQEKHEIQLKQKTDSENSLLEKNSLLKEEVESLEGRIKDETSLLVGQIDQSQSTNEKLKKEIDSRQEKIDELNNIVISQQKDFEDVKEKLKDMTETLRKETTKKKEAAEKLKVMQQELDGNNDEIREMKLILEAFKKKQSDDGQLLEEARQIDTEKKNSELVKEFRNKLDEYQFKLKEMAVMEQQFTSLNQVKENLIQENVYWKKLADETKIECDNLLPLVSKSKELEPVKKQNEALQVECNKMNLEISKLKVRLNQLDSDNKNTHEEHDKIVLEMEGYKARCEFLETSQNTLNEVVKSKMELETKLRELEDKQNQQTHSTSNDARKHNSLDNNDTCDKMKLENENLKAEYAKLEEQCNNFNKVKRELESEIAELEKHFNEVLNEKQLLQDEIQELKIAAINAPISNGNNNTKLDNLTILKQDSLLSSVPTNGANVEGLHLEIESLRDKVTQYKSQDLTNKSSIEFYEHELQKLKNKNEKINRKLDETLMTLSHCTELSSSTEIEYLKNVLYNYMLGKESIILARVIAAVCKFDADQTEAVLQKEQQKQTLLGQLGIL